MNYLLVRPSADIVAKAGFGRVAHVPCIFDQAWNYHRPASEFLIARALLDWPPPQGGLYDEGAAYLTEKSLETYGEHLCNLLEWTSQTEGHDWHSIEYTKDLIEGYQADMLSGAWSSRGVGLKGSSINARMFVACSFLSWAAAQGLRGPFKYPKKAHRIHAPSGTDAAGQHGKDVITRVGRVRQSSGRMRMPTDPEISRWYEAVRIRHGANKASMCRLVIETGVRRAEAAGWRVDTIPLCRSDWEIEGDSVMVDIRYGTKGPHYGKDHSDKVGPVRHIAIPIEFAETLARYRDVERTRDRAAWVRSAGSREEMKSRLQAVPSPHLFQSPSSGTRISAKTLYDTWTDVSWVPFDGWSPHQGRHYWACKTLLLLAKERAAGDGFQSGFKQLDSFIDLARSDIMLRIRPQLGHLHESTTEIYLAWLRMVLVNGLHEQYALSLDDLFRADVGKVEG